MEDNKLHHKDLDTILSVFKYYEAWSNEINTDKTHFYATRDKIIRIQHQLKGEKDDFQRGKELGYAMGYHAATKGEPPEYELGEWLDDCDSSN